MSRGFQKGLNSLDIRRKPRTPDEPRAKDWHKRKRQQQLDGLDTFRYMVGMLTKEDELRCKQNSKS